MTDYRRRITLKQPIATRPAQAPPRTSAPGLCGRYLLVTDMMEMTRRTTEEQSVDQEYNSFVDAPLSPDGTNIIQFWEVSYHC